MGYILNIYVLSTVQEARLARIHIKAIFDIEISLTGLSVSRSIGPKAWRILHINDSPTCWQKNVTSKTTEKTAWHTEAIQKVFNKQQGAGAWRSASLHSSLLLSLSTLIHTFLISCQHYCNENRSSTFQAGTPLSFTPSPT